MTDRIVLANMQFEGRHGDHEWERETPQPFEVDVELRLDLRPAGGSDELARTVDYGRVFDIAREIVESRTFHLLERLAEAIASEVLAAFPLVEEIDVRVRKPKVKLSGKLHYAGVEIRRRRS
jgi:dihydroneopterin aldolase